MITYSEHSDGVDGELIEIRVSHFVGELVVKRCESGKEGAGGAGPVDGCLRRCG